MDKELIEKAKGAKSVEELLSLAEENKIELSLEKANEIFSKLHKTGEIKDDELDAVSGGGCSELEWVSGAKYKQGQIVKMRRSTRYGSSIGGGWCRYCALSENAEVIGSSEFFVGGRIAYSTVYTVKCLGCGYTTEAADPAENPGAEEYSPFVIVGAV